MQVEEKTCDDAIDAAIKQRSKAVLESAIAQAVELDFQARLPQPRPQPNMDYPSTRWP